MKLYNKPQHVKVTTTETVTVRRLDRAGLATALARVTLAPADRAAIESNTEAGRYDDDLRTLLDHVCRCKDQAPPAAQAGLQSLAERIARGDLHPERSETREVETWEWVDPEDPRAAPAIRTQAAAQRLAGIGGGR